MLTAISHKTRPVMQVEDTVGAGDSFAAAFLHAHLSGASLKVMTVTHVFAVSIAC